MNIKNYEELHREMWEFVVKDIPNLWPEMSIYRIKINALRKMGYNIENLSGECFACQQALENCNNTKRDCNFCPIIYSIGECHNFGSVWYALQLATSKEEALHLARRIRDAEWEDL